MQDKKEASRIEGFKINPKKDLTRDSVINLIKAIEGSQREEVPLNEEIDIIMKELVFFASIQEFQNALIALNQFAAQIVHFPNEEAFLEYIQKETHPSVLKTQQVVYFFALMNEVVKHQNELIMTGSKEDKNIENEILPFCVLSNAKRALKFLTPMLSPLRIDPLYRSAFDNDVAKLDIFFSCLRTHKECWINDRYFYRQATHLPAWDSLYIESFHNIFNDISHKNYIFSILNNIQERLIMCKDSSYPAFIHYKTTDVKELFLNISQYLGSDNLIQKKIEEQIASGATMRSFNQECKRAGSKTLLLGGTYGNGCVLAAAQKYGKTIFTKTNGSFQASYPHCRWVNYHKKPYIHEHSLIDPQITEGFDPFNPKQNVEKQGFSEFPALLEVSHRYKTNFLTFELGQVRSLAALPLEQQRQLIRSECVDYSKLAHFKPSTLSRIRQRSEQDKSHYPILSWMQRGSRPTVNLKRHRQEHSDEGPSSTQNMAP
ncbi:hypothetical protein [Legionella sp. PC997]|uniref:hypothetical protein n=1 Tax=Legionella sp. PC997 TaxID=2755562 RepID=UPI001862C241|nr:hypothetical protein [Legionella sp. PC997]QMT61652.1 hypothetical protein HBNCFIEN_03056 [Legionella sp. PC997]